MHDRVDRTRPDREMLTGSEQRECPRSEAVRLLTGRVASRAVVAPECLEFGCPGGRLAGRGIAMSESFWFEERFVGHRRESYR